MKVAVQVHGRLTGADQEALSRALQRQFASLPDAAGESEPVVLTFLEDTPHGIDEARRSCDVRICIRSRTDEGGEGRRFLERLINRSPLVPVVFRDQEEIEWDGLSKDVRRAVETSWWWIVRPIDLPVMIVGREQQIIKANDAALAFFGPDLLGRYYRAAVEDAEDAPDLPDDHPVREALAPTAPMSIPAGSLAIAMSDPSTERSSAEPFSSASRSSPTSIPRSTRSWSSTWT